MKKQRRLLLSTFFCRSKPQPKAWLLLRRYVVVLRHVFTFKCAQRGGVEICLFGFDLWLGVKTQGFLK